MKTFPENAAFLDLGCGEGHLIKQLSTLHPDIAFVGIEPTFFNKTGSDASKARLLKRSIYELPLLDNSMDIILVKEVLQHVAFMTKAFEEIRRISKRGARIIVIKRNPFSILGLLKKPFELSGRWMYPWDSPFRERDGI
jgi:ubiquinone/menaquinone biosynthesis C-methylase UbiE